MTATEIERLKVTVEGDASKLARELNKAGAMIQRFGDTAKSIGMKMTAGLTAPIAAAGAAAVKAFASQEQAMADLRAAANPTAAELEKIRAAVENLSLATGAAPADTTRALNELLKAGLPLRDVLDGAAEAALKFGRLSEMGISEAATILVDAAAVFGKEGATVAKAADVVIAAADATSLSIKDVADSFSAGGATMALFNQSMKDSAAALALLSKGGVKGADAGTILKTMFLRISTGVDTAAAVIDKYGLSFRNAQGEIRPMLEIIQELESKLGGLNLEARDKALADLFGDRGIRGAAILLQQGAKGFRQLQDTMATSLSTAQKFDTVTGTLNGQLDRLKAQLLIVAGEIGQELAPVLQKVMDTIKDGLQWWRGLSAETKRTVVAIAAVAAAVGPVVLGLGLLAGSVNSAITLFATLGGSAVALKAGLVGLAVVGAVLLAREIRNANAEVKKLNAEMERADELSRKLSERFAKGQAKTIQQADAMKPAERQAFLAREIARMEKELKGQRELTKVQERIVADAQVPPAWLLKLNYSTAQLLQPILGSAEREFEEKQLREMQGKIRETEQALEALKAAAAGPAGGQSALAKGMGDVADEAERATRAVERMGAVLAGSAADVAFLFDYRRMVQGGRIPASGIPAPPPSKAGILGAAGAGAFMQSPRAGLTAAREAGSAARLEKLLEQIRDNTRPEGQTSSTNDVLKLANLTP